MTTSRRLFLGLALVSGAAVLTVAVERACAYVEAPMSLGAVVAQSSHIVLMRVERVDREKNLILYRKVRDLKGIHPADSIKHNIGRNGFHPREWQYPMEWAEPGKLAVFFHNGGASETCLGTDWYQAYAGGEWWNMSHGEPFLLRSYYGRPEKLAALVTEMLAGKEVLAPCLVDGNKEEMKLRRGKVQRLRASLKIQDYNPRRDFAGWGGEDFRRVEGMPGFTHTSSLARVDPDAQAISAADLDGDGRADLCLAGSNRVALVLNAGDSLGEATLPGVTGGCRSAVWADYNGDGRPDLFLATPAGPRLYTNRDGALRDDSHLVPKLPGSNLTAAAWLDHDGDGRPDLLVATGFHGLRLLRNRGPVAPGSRPLELGEWYVGGPFSNTGQKGFTTAYPPEQEIDFTKTYPGKGGGQAGWKKGEFTDGQVNSLSLFEPARNAWAAVYLYREITCNAAQELPVSLGSDDTLVVWLNGEKIVAQNEYRAAAPDQAVVTLKLKPGKNKFLMKVCNGDGDWAFYFAPKKDVPPAATWEFEDVSDKVGLGVTGLAGGVRCDTLTVADVDGDGRPDFLGGTGTGLLARNTGRGFAAVADSGIHYRPGQVGPTFADYDNDGHPDLFVPQSGVCKLFRNRGDGRFTEVTARAGDLARPLGQATSAAWGDFDNDGHPDLVVGCLRGPNRFFRNKGDGTFEDATEAVGLHQRVYNTQAVCLVDMNNDGVLDLVFNNEGQDSAVLLGDPARARNQTPVTFQVSGSGGVVGSRVRLTGRGGKPVAAQQISGGDGRGGQPAPTARFALQPGTYRVEVRYTSGVVRAREFTVAQTPLRAVLDDQTPKQE